MIENDGTRAPKSPENLFRLSENLSENSQIGTIRVGTIRLSRQRYVNLRTQEMFDSLVDLYAGVFMDQWEHYKTFMESFPPPPGVPPHIYAARSYISMWFIDLYVSISESLRKSLSNNEHYRGELFRISKEYDKYLTLLNASIRPTLIKNALDNARHVPIIAEYINVYKPNPFRISNFTPPDRDLFRGFTQIMKEKCRWHFTPLSKNASGRPCWLFDWHTKNRVFSWFPAEDNYNLEDFTLAYILGTACSPNLGVRDVDDWQYFSKGIVPHGHKPKDYDRVVERRFYGSYEVRTMEIETDSSLPPERGIRPTKKPKNDIQEVDRPMPRFKLIDWVYDHQIVVEMDSHKRTGVLRSLSLVWFGLVWSFCDEYFIFFNRY